MMKTQFGQLVTSRGFWTVVIVALYAALVGIFKVFPSVTWLNDLVGLVGFVATSYFKINPSQPYGNPPV
jgi:hypothetical protein